MFSATSFPVQQNGISNRKPSPKPAKKHLLLALLFLTIYANKRWFAVALRLVMRRVSEVFFAIYSMNTNLSVHHTDVRTPLLHIL